MIVALDATPLSLLTQRLGIPAADQCRAWADSLSRGGHQLVLPAVADYEVRRELLRAGKSASIARLDGMRRNPRVTYLPMTDEALFRAASLWADARAAGLPTAAPSELDCDVILVAILMTSNVDLTQVVVATSNVAHLARFLPAHRWQSIQP